MQRNNLLNQDVNDPQSDLYWYNQASKAMRDKDVNDPASWGWWAAVHQYTSNITSNKYWTSTDNDGQRWVTNLEHMDTIGNELWWKHCPHGDPKFLPWHRAYMLAFENALLQVISTLPNAPAEWALPYWDYTTSSQNGFVLPPAFAVDNDSLYFLDRNLSFSAANYYSGTVNGTSLEDFGSYRSAIENVPHNVVHTGLKGAMQSIQTAGLDPVFYMHHCQIDRLWALWSQITTTEDSYDEVGYFKWLYVDGGELKVQDAKIAFNDCMSTQNIPVTDLNGKVLATLSYQYEMAQYEQQFLNEVIAKRNNRTKLPKVLERGRTPMAAFNANDLEQLIFATSTEKMTVANSPQKVLLKSLEQKSLVKKLTQIHEVQQSTDIHSLDIHIEGVVSDGPGGNYLVVLNQVNEDGNVESSWNVGYVSFFGSTIEDGQTILTGGKPLSVSVSVPDEYAQNICEQCANNKMFSISLIPEQDDEHCGTSTIDKMVVELTTRK